MGHRDRVWPSIRRRVHQAVAGGIFYADAGAWRRSDLPASLPSLQSVRKGPEKSIKGSGLWTTSKASARQETVVIC